MRGIELEDGVAKADDYQLLDVSGVGARKLAQYVTPFLTLIKTTGVES